MKSGIDQSLNLLKQLQFKLKNQNQRHTASFNYRTQHDSDIPATKKKQWGSRLITQYEINEDRLLQENKYLKKYVNKLLKMNEYLKNQLIKKDKYSHSVYQNRDHQETDLLKIEIQYLQELNREKQLQLKLLTNKKKKHTRCQSSQPFTLESAKKKSQFSVKKMPSLTNSHQRTSSYTKSTRNQVSYDKTVKNHNKYHANKRCPLCYS